jgi:hypothetical protein
VLAGKIGLASYGPTNTGSVVSKCPCPGYSHRSRNPRRAERNSGSAIFSVTKWRIALRASALPGYWACSTLPSVVTHEHRIPHPRRGRTAR